MSTGRAGSLAGQTVVVIGGSAGIGLETARLARAEGADVIDRRRATRTALERAGREIGATHNGFRRHELRRSSSGSSTSCPTPIDHVLVTGAGPYYAPLAELDFDEAPPRTSRRTCSLPMQVARARDGTGAPRRDADLHQRHGRVAGPGRACR